MKQSTKSLNLPKPIAAHFDTDKGDSETLSRCFTENAVVKDEGHTHQGRAAIKQWKSDASKKYKYTSEPFVCEQRTERLSLPADSPETFPAAPLIFDSSSSWKATRLRRWKSSREDALNQDESETINEEKN